MTTRTRPSRTLGAALAGGLALASAGAASVLTVTSTADEIDDDVGDGVCHAAVADACTLRAAVMQANANASANDVTIVLPAGTYTFAIDPAGPNGANTGDLNLAAPIAGDPLISITGAGAAVTVIAADDRDRIFRIEGSRRATISGVTMRNGSSASGGAIWNDGDLSVSDCQLLDNAALTGPGGAVFNSGFGDLYINHSTLSDNRALDQSAGRGGAIYTEGGFYLDRVTITGNQAGNGGGGLFRNTEGGSTILRSTISGNTVLAGDGHSGGGIRNDADNELEIFESTISGNHADQGGGIFNAGNPLYLTNSTVSQNSSDKDGGGIHNLGTFWTYNATIVFNRADDSLEQFGGEGGGVFNANGAGFYPRNSVIAGNTAHGAPDPDDCSGALGTLGYNKFGDLGGCVLGHGGACGGTDTLLGSVSELGPLQFNGGPTRTHAVAAESGLIDGVAGTCTCLGAETNDQRGGARPSGPRCDIGAFEYGALQAGLLFADGFELGNLRAWN